MTKRGENVFEWEEGGESIRVGIETWQRKGENKILNVSKTQKGDSKKWGNKREEYTVMFEVKLKRYWTNRSKIAQKPQQG